MTRPVLIAVAAVLVLFAPNVPYLFEGVLGATGSDALKHVWSQWFVVYQLQEQGGLSFETSLVNHPSGGPFFSLDTFNALLGMPLRLFLDPVPTFNLVLIANLIAAATGGVFLSRLFTINLWASATAGFGFACSAWVLAFPLASGVSETAVFWPIPFILLLAHRMWFTPGWKRPALAGALLALQGAACWSHGITAGLLLLGLFVVTAIQKPRDWQQPDRLKRIAILLLTALLFAIPGYLAIAGTVSAEDAIKSRTLSLFHSAPVGPLAALETNNMALSDFLAWGEWGLRKASVGTDRLMYAANPGIALLVLAVMGWRTRTRSTSLLMIGAIFMLFMSLGPRIYLDHARSIGGVPNPIYLASYWLIPLVNATIHSVDRFAVGLQLCVAMLAAIGVAHLSPRWRPWCLLAVIAELTLLSSGPWPIPMAKAQAHPASEVIQNHPNQGAVLDIPFMEGDSNHRWFLGDIFLQQTIHERPIPFQLEGQGLETVGPSLRANPFFEKLAVGALSNRPLAPGCDGLQGLIDLEFGWLVWRPELTPNDRHEDFRTILDSCLSIREDFGDQIVYEMVP